MDRFFVWCCRDCAMYLLNIDDLYFLSCRTLYTAVDNETLLGLYI